MHASRVALLTSLALLAACTAGPTFERPVAQLPERWHGASSSDSKPEIAQEWWRQFADPTLDTLIERARQNNLDLRVAALRVAQARMQRSIATGSRLPAVQGGAGYQRERQSEYGVNTRLINIIGPPGNREQIIDALAEPFDVYQAGFDASWEIDLWGRVRRSVEAADANLTASNESLHDAELTLIAEVARIYLELGGTRDQLRIAREDVAAGTDQLELTQMRVKGGIATDLELSVQQAEVGNVRSQIPTLAQREAQLRNALAFLLGSEPDAINELLATSLLLQIVPDLRAAVPAELARRRPDIRQAEARLQAATAEIGVAVADLYPRISLTGNFVQQSLQASDLGAWGARQWSIGPSLAVPIFQGGRLRTVVELRKLQQQEAAIAYQRTVLGAWHEIENSLAALTAERERGQELAAVLAASRNAYEVAHMRYQHGLTNYLMDLDAHRTLLQAHRAASDSRTQQALRLVALCKALGGGWQDATAAR